MGRSGEGRFFEYVKVCSLYGAGFYYMPGTDICIKIGGYVRFQAYAGWGTTGTANQFVNGGGYQDRILGDNNDFLLRTRAVVTFDTRQQTEYGTLRTYTLIGYTHDTTGGSGQPGLYANRGFIQLAGFTVGKAQSFYDIFSNPSVSYFGIPGSDTGDGGVVLAGYTAQFGNGFSGTIAVEDAQNRRTSIIQNTGNPAVLPPALAGIALPISSYGTNHYGNMNMPDVVGALRVDQAWGSAQVMAALHQVRADYYDNANIALGHPDDKLGWVVGAGAILKTDFISPGDKFQFQVNYTEGAVRYLNQVQGTSNYAFFSGSTLGFGWQTDAVYAGTNGANGSSLELTKGWEISASYDHVWNQRWKTSVYGGYMDISFSNNANRYLCGDANVLLGCNADWNTYWVGSRTQFNINSSTYMGLDVIYQKLNSMTPGGVIGLAAAHGHVGNYTPADQDALAVTFRVHRDFLP